MRWQREEAAVSIEDSSVPDGTLPTKPPKVEQAWIGIHTEESGEGGRTIFQENMRLKLGLEMVSCIFHRRRTRIYQGELSNVSGDAGLEYLENAYHE